MESVLNKMNKNEIKDKMVKALETQFSRKYERVRCPSLKVMAEYINEVFPQYKASVRVTTSSKERSGKGCRYVYSRRYYDGNMLEVMDKKTFKNVYQHDSTETYRCNTDVANWIIREEKNHA